MKLKESTTKSGPKKSSGYNYVQGSVLCEKVLSVREGGTDVRHNASYFHKQRSFVSPQKRTKSVFSIMKHSTVTAGREISYAPKMVQGFKEFSSLTLNMVENGHKNKMLSASHSHLIAARIGRREAGFPYALSVLISN